MIREEFTRLLREVEEYIGRQDYAQELARAQKGYFEQVGSPREGESFFEMRLASFIEWFAFDRNLEQHKIPPVSVYLSDPGRSFSDSEREIGQGFKNSIHSIFKILKKKNGEAALRNLFDGRKYIKVEGLPPSLHKGDVIEARIVPAGKSFQITEAYCYHPPQAHKFIMQELKRARKNGDDLEGLMRQFMAMSSKWERYPRMKLSEIYKWIL